MEEKTSGAPPEGAAPSHGGWTAAFCSLRRESGVAREGRRQKEEGNVEVKGGMGTRDGPNHNEGERGLRLYLLDSKHTLFLRKE